MVYGLVIIAGFGKWFLFMPGNTWIVFLDAVMSAPIWIGLSMLIPSMLADVCDDDELHSGQRREGTFGAIYNWIVKLGIAVASPAARGCCCVRGFRLQTRRSAGS